MKPCDLQVTLFSRHGRLFSFRLILAMDPRYGEISRAMRNRGVEIFMVGEVGKPHCGQG